MVLKNWTATCKRLKVDCYLTSYTKINSKWVKYFRVSPETIKLLEEDIGSMFFDTSLSSIFLNTMSPQARETTEKINKWGYIKLKNYTAKETMNKMKRQPTNWEKIFANHISNEGLISNTYKDLIQLNNKKTTRSKNGQRI